MAPALLAAALLAAAMPAEAQDEDGSLRIGVLATLEGAFAPLGQDALRGHELAMEEHGRQAGGRPIEALVEATDGTPDSVTAKARLLIERGAVVVVGPLTGVEGIAMRDFAASVPAVTFINGASAAQDATLRAPAGNFFRFTPDSMQWIAGLGRHVYERKGIRRVVAVAEDYSLAHAQLMGFMVEFCALGGELAAKHWVSPGSSDSARLAEALAGAEADALFLALEPRAAASFLRAYGAAGGQAAIVAGSTTLSGRLLAADDTLRSLLLGAVAAQPVSEHEDNPAWAAFSQAYRARFPDAGPAPSLFALAYYVNTRALLLALDETGGRLGDGQRLLREALAGLRFETPFGGPVALDANRQAVTGNFIVEVGEAADGSLVLRTAHAVPAVGQTLGLAPDAFLSLGPPSRHNPGCSAIAALETGPPSRTAEPQPTAPQTEAEDQPPSPEAEIAAGAPGAHPLLRSEKDAAMTQAAPRIIPCLRYADAPAAIAWLKRAFGFTETMVVPGPDGTIAHAQLAFGSGMIMLGSAQDDALALKSPCDLGGIAQTIYVIVENADAHYARALLAGAEIVREPEDTPYGSREYAARDPEGHLWNFGTYRPAMGE